MREPVVWIVARNDMFYIDMAIRSVIDHACVVVLDTGSIDDTPKVIHKIEKLYPGKMYFETKFFGTPGKRFPPDFIEMDVRNHAIDRAIEVFKGVEWLIQLDADEIVNEHYWEEFKKAKSSGENTFGYATNILTSPNLVLNDKSYFQMWSGKYNLFDPHVRVWNASVPVRWYPRTLGETIHCVPKVDGVHELFHGYVSLDNIHFHLHRSFGPKSIWHYLTGHRGLSGREASEILGVDYSEMFHNQKLMQEKFPQFFDLYGKFKPPVGLNEDWVKNSIPVSHPIPDFVVERWKSWGYFCDNWFDSQAVCV